jgi:myo-inositol-1-phosphate synthase
MKHSYNYKYCEIDSDDNIKNIERNIKIITENCTKNKLGIMIIGLAGNNGSTLTAGVLGYQKNLNWEDKNGLHEIDFLGSIYQYGSTNIGFYKDGKPYSKLLRNIIKMKKIDDLIISGWDIVNSNLYQACKNNKILDINLLEKLKNDLENIQPLSGIFYENFIASNQKPKVNNIKTNNNKWKDVLQIINDINSFKDKNNLSNVIVLWSGSTERMNDCDQFKTCEELLEKIKNDEDNIVPPSIIYAVASIMTHAIFVNTSPQNTIVPSLHDLALKYNTFIVGNDLKSGQTKLKSVLADYLASSGIKPLSIISYNHLGNNDGLNLKEPTQFRSKEITKRGVIDDIIDENKELFKNEKPDHEIVIKYVPAVGDSKRAIDEYYSELFLKGKNILSIYNLCEDSLLAVPILLDIIMFSELFSRIKFELENKEIVRFSTNLSLLSFFFKSPETGENNEYIYNAFFKQRYALDNFIKICAGIPINDFVHLNFRIS